MPGTAYTLKLDPWAAEYGGAVQIGEIEEDVAGQIDTTVETQTWAAIERPLRPEGARRLAFVDGVRRVEHRLLVEGGAGTVFGLLGSFGVGVAMAASGRVLIEHARIERVVVTGGGVLLDRFRPALPHADTLLHFEPETEPDNTPAAPIKGLQRVMRTAEAVLAEALAGDCEAVFLDGPLTYLAATVRGPVAGLVKRLQRNYLEPDAARLLARLSPGERTPLFLIEGKRDARYSWYLRLANGRSIESALTGVVRLETHAAIGLDAARRLAGLSAVELPRFASDSSRDPRAPQNLLPVGALETRLTHLLGDHGLVRRAIERHLHTGAAA